MHVVRLQASPQLKMGKLRAENSHRAGLEWVPAANTPCDTRPLFTQSSAQLQLITSHPNPITVHHCPNVPHSTAHPDSRHVPQPQPQGSCPPPQLPAPPRPTTAPPQMREQEGLPRRPLRLPDHQRCRQRGGTFHLLRGQDVSSMGRGWGGSRASLASDCQAQTTPQQWRVLSLCLGMVHGLLPLTGLCFPAS